MKERGELRPLEGGLMFEYPKALGVCSRRRLMEWCDRVATIDKADLQCCVKSKYIHQTWYRSSGTKTGGFGSSRRVMLCGRGSGTTKTQSPASLYPSDTRVTG